ncbi:DEAD/DEAH box helicase family protein [Staphylococcus simulans]|uniref:DEAD/DEAH box helicase family protein n=1 Tax=Staphylococcus simulans TaxID=1286 RepID=UPI001E540A4B|nr:DEAD/DEAH box helicase family protein [Staphylococcus simulans]MCD8916245.1 DEAD/DEAH box helicase family protein [Staphylococcus simulans]
MFDVNSFKLQYRTNNDNIYDDFYKKCLDESVKYDRAAGYFTSESLKLIARGLDVFLINGGKIRIVANPKLNINDIKAIEKGHVAKESLIEKRLLEEVEISRKTIEDETLNVLSWLIFKGQLEIKIAFTENNSIYHEKFGIFTDETGESIAFSGSANETFGGLSQNFEKIDVYCGERDNHRIKNAVDDFEELWRNQTNGLNVMDLPNSIKEKLLSYRSSFPEIFGDDIKGKSDANKLKIQPRHYQLEAINLWEQAGGKGILEMATGTGKTITSLLAIRKAVEENKKGITIIVVPFQHLVTQWSEDIDLVLGQPILKCMYNKHKWLNKAKRIIQDYSIGLIQRYVFITTYDTAESEHFKEIIKKLSGEANLIADECHSITKNGFYDFPFEKFSKRLGLSATPDRWWDEDGTNFIKQCLGDVVYEYTLDEAIKQNKLTPYQYHPHIVEFSEQEMNKYNKFTQRIINTLNKTNDIDENDENVSQLLRDRASLVSKAENKFNNFLRDLKNESLTDLSHTLVYCAPGAIDITVKKISELGIRVSKFNASVNNKDRQELLNMFEEGIIQILVAIKCLDEGVDIPATKKAYFLSSTSNPREFVQRRGRILRKFENKRFAEIHDYIVLPLGQGFDNFERVASKELPRFAEFSRSAINYAQSKEELYDILESYNLTHLLYKEPWMVYQEMKERFKNEYNQ